MPRPGRQTFPIDPNVVLLNHASFGLPSSAILARAEQLRRRIELDAAHYLAGPMLADLGEQAAGIGALIGARPGALALVANSTEAASSVATSLARDRALRVVLLDSEYPSVIRAWQVATSASGGSVQLVPIVLPAGGAGVVLAALDAAVSGRFDVLVISLIASSTALHLPARQIAEWVAARGAITVVDAAHGVGHVELDVDDLGAAIVFGTLHKWLPAPRPVGFLWVSDRFKDVVRPATVALRWDDSLLERFSWRGTWDPVPALCLGDALAQWQQWRDSGALARAQRLADLAAQHLTAAGLVATGAVDLIAPRLRSFIVPELGAQELNAALDAADVRAWVGRSAAGQTLLRIATHVHTTEAHVERLVEIIREFSE